MSFDRRVEELLDRMQREGIDVYATSTGGLVSHANGCRIPVFTAPVRELDRVPREEPRRSEHLISAAIRSILEPLGWIEVQQAGDG